MLRCKSEREGSPTGFDKQAQSAGCVTIKRMGWIRLVSCSSGQETAAVF